MTALPPWLEPLPDAGEQRALDEWAIKELGIPGLELMERAGSGLAQLVSDRAPEGPIAVVCGKGNNGGDGYVAARVLREQGRSVRVLTLVDPGELQGDAKANFERLPGPPPDTLAPEGLEGVAAIVDAILGTGFSGTPREPAAGAIEAINTAGAQGAAGEAVEVIACDVPSGVNGSTGEVEGAAVRATATATFHASKPGLWIAPGKDHAGQVRTVDIGIPPGGPGEPSIGLINPEVVDAIPRRGRESTKFAAGSVLVCGGSTGLTGAPSMASESAMRAGAGYVTALVPGSLSTIFEVRLLEVMTMPLPDEDGSLTPDALDVVIERCERADALVLGPGFGRRGWGPGARPPDRPRGAGVAAARRGWTQRPRRLAVDDRRARGGRRPHPARRRARATARDRQRCRGGEATRKRAPGGEDRRLRGVAEGRRHAGRESGRSGGSKSRWRLGARHGRYGGCPLGRDRGLSGQAHGRL